MRLPISLRGVVLLALGVHMQHRFHGSPIGYAGLAAAAAASWVGVPGPGEPVLVATGILAAKNKLDLASVLVVAWAAATAGGVAGWLIGMKAGRKILTAPGPLRKVRMSVVARGDSVFERFSVLAVVFTPSWIAGIHHVRPAVYLPTNAVAAAVWAAGIGVGAYYAGPAIVDVVDDAGLVFGIALVTFIVGVILGELFFRRRRRARAQARTSGDL